MTRNDCNVSDGNNTEIIFGGLSLALGSYKKDQSDVVDHFIEQNVFRIKGPLYCRTD